MSEGTATWGLTASSSASGAVSMADSPNGNYPPNADTSLRTISAVPSRGGPVG